MVLPNVRWPRDRSKVRPAYLLYVVEVSMFLNVVRRPERKRGAQRCRRILYLYVIYGTPAASDGLMVVKASSNEALVDCFPALSVGGLHPSVPIGSLMLSFKTRMCEGRRR